MKTKILRNVLALVAAVIAPFALAATVDPAKSEVKAVFKQLGVPVEAHFNKFAAVIDYDPANVAQAKAQVQIDVASFDLGDAEYNKEVANKTWFNAAAFPQATFVSSTITPAGAGKFTAAGTLTIKGKSQNVSVPVTVKQAGADQVFEGTLSIKRLYFNIGEGEWKDTDTVADEVLVKFKFVKH
jgi:polyisoprenoid-binding protein YceI